MRLIDADKMKEGIARQEKDDIASFMHLCGRLNEEGLKRALEDIQMLIRMPEYRKSDQEICSLLDNQPTAYDVDKVMERIKERAFIPGEWLAVSDTKVVRLDDALEIIKAETGGGGCHDRHRKHG